jgi:hypothetical protein
MNHGISIKNSWSISSTNSTCNPSIKLDYASHSTTVTEQRVTAQWRYAVANPDFFATITGLAAHYSLLCMAATYEGSRTHRM